jgi:histidinol-phosphate aminotransferase
MFNIDTLTRKNIQQMKAYSSARSEYKGKADIWLDANENPNETDLNRYPDPLQLRLKEEISKLKEVDPNKIFIGNGSDEAIDLLFRAFCEPGSSKAFIFPPTYGMYEVSAAINNVEVEKIPLTENFELPTSEKIKAELSPTGLLFICSPNNPTGNSTDLQRVKEIATCFSGLVVVDEAYIDFSENKSAISLLAEIPNLVVLQTFSKAYGLAGARIGMAFANPDIIAILNRIKPPYNINTLSMTAAQEVLSNNEKISIQINEIKEERNRLVIELLKLKFVNRIFPSEANFLLIQFSNSKKVFNTLLNAGIVVRNRATQVKKCLRITVGTKIENNKLIKILKDLQG